MKRESELQQRKKNIHILKVKAVAKEVITNNTEMSSKDIKKRVVKAVAKVAKKVARENIERKMIESKILVVIRRMRYPIINLNLQLRLIQISQKLLLSKLKTRTLRSA